MPPEPDNKMDELLKAYAKKRAEEAGARPELHPAMRRLLHGEVARVYPKAAAKGSSPWYGSILLLWPRFAFTAGIVVLLGGTLWMLNNNPAKQTYALNNAKPSAQPASSTQPVAEFQQFRDSDLAARSKQSADRKLNVAQKAEAPVMLRRAPTQASAPVNEPLTTVSKDTLDEAKLAERVRLSLAPPKQTELLADNERSLDGSESKQSALAPAPATVAAPPRPSSPVRGLDEQLAKSVARKSQVASGAPPAGPLPEALKQIDLASDALSVNTVSEREAGLRGDVAKQTQPPISNFSLDAGAQARTEKENLSRSPSLETLAETRKAGEADLYAYGFVTSWTNTVHDAAQSWQFFSSQNGANLSLAYDDVNSPNKLGALQDGVAAPSPDKNYRKATGSDTDSDFAGGFARPGGDGRFAKAKGLGGALNAPTPAAAPATGAPVGGAGSGGAKTDANSGAVNYRARGLQAPTDPSNISFGSAVRNGRLEDEWERRNQPGKILDNFQLVQNGDAIRLVDADGSVYAGAVVVWNEPTQFSRQQVRSESAAAATAVERFYRKVEETPAPVGVSGLQNSNLVHFQVIGTNNTTKQLVVVSGQLGRIIAASKPALPPLTVKEPLEAKKLTELDKSSVLSVQAAVGAGSNFAAQPKSPNEPVRITGIAIVGTNQMRLDAIRR